MNTATPVEQRTLSLNSIVAVIAVGAICISAIVWHHRRAESELSAMPTADRLSLYERTLMTINTTCAHAEGGQLRDYCQQQAAFVSRFPECDSRCQSACQQYLPRPTK